MPRHLPRTAATACVLALAMCATTATAQANPNELGPQPTQASLEASTGPFAIAEAQVTSPSGFRGATVYYPTTTGQGRFGLIVMTPGMLALQSQYTWLSRRVASHGFVVINVDTLSTLDFPEPRARQAARALQQVAALSQQAVTPYYGKVDVARQGAMGHSMGGAGTLALARDNPGLKAAVALTPGGLSTSFPTVQVPSLVLACGKDPIVSGNTTYRFYSSLPATLDKAYIETIEGAHTCPTSTAPAALQNLIGRFTIAWLKRFVDGDTRYTPFISQVADPAVLRFAQSGNF